MYKPVKDGIEKSVKAVVYLEVQPPSELSELVHCFWEIKTKAPLPQDFLYHIIPDACVNILFNQLDPKVTAITALQIHPKTLNLGKVFHYVGIQLLPGVWKGHSEEIRRGFVGDAYRGKLPLIPTNDRLIPLEFSDKKIVLSNLIKDLIDKELVAPNIVVSKILARINETRTVEDMARVAGLSSRQLQRTLKSSTGFSPRDFLKILKVQQSFREDYLAYYADQAHFIHSFRRITGYTPFRYTKKFDV